MVGHDRLTGTSAVLRIVHATRGLPRSDITQRSGLSRSAVSKIIRSLAADGLVEETVKLPTRSGRPSGWVTPTRQVAVLVGHVGYRDVRASLVCPGAQEIRQRSFRFSKPPDAHEIVHAFVCAVDELADKHDVSIIGAVLVSHPDSLNGDERTRAAVQASTGLDTALMNEAHAVALAECTFGVAKSASSVVHLHESLGVVTGTVVIGGTLMSGANSQAGRFAHFSARANGRLCPCGRRGCIQAEVAGVLHPSHTSSVPPMSRKSVLAAIVKLVRDSIDPEVIVLSGALSDLVPASETVAHDRGTKIVRGQFLSDCVPVGAAQSMLEQFFHQRTHIEWG